MSLFAGTGFFTQSAVLFPTSIEKNKKTEACSRDPQASSLLHGKGRHRRPFFTGGRWGRQILGGGGGCEGGAAGLRIAKSLRSLHLPCKSTGNNRPDRGLVRKGGWARMPGQHRPGGWGELIPKEPQIRGPALPSQRCFWLRRAGGCPLPSTPHSPSGKGLCFDPQVKGWATLP